MKFLWYIVHKIHCRIQYNIMARDRRVPGRQQKTEFPVASESLLFVFWWLRAHHSRLVTVTIVDLMP